MSQTLAEAAREFGFNPSERRGPDGKWLRTGRAVERTVAKAEARDKQSREKIGRKVLKGIGFPSGSQAKLEKREKKSRQRLIDETLKRAGKG